MYAGPAGPNSESVGTSETVPSRFRSHSTNSADYLGAQSQTGDHLVNMTRIGGTHKRPKISVTRKLGVSLYIKDIKVILLIFPTRPKHLPGIKASVRCARSRSRRKIQSVVSSSMDRGMNGIARQCKIYNELLENANMLI